MYKLLGLLILVAGCLADERFDVVDRLPSTRTHSEYRIDQPVFSRGDEELSETYSPPATYSPPRTQPPVTYAPPRTQPPVTYAPPRTQPPVTYAPPRPTYAPPRPTYAPPRTLPPVTYAPPRTAPPVTYGPPRAPPPPPPPKPVYGEPPVVSRVVPVAPTFFHSAPARFELTVVDDASATGFRTERVDFTGRPLKEGSYDYVSVDGVPVSVHFQ